MHPPAAEGFRHGTNTGLHKIINLLLAHHQDILRIPGSLHHIPAQRRLQMRKRLDTGHHFDSEQIRIIVAFLQFFSRVSPAECSKIRILRHLIGILGIKHHRIHSQRSLQTDIFLYSFHIQHTVPGAVQHNSVFIQVHVLPVAVAFHRCAGMHCHPLFQFAHKRHQRAEQKGFPACPQYGFPPLQTACHFTAVICQNHMIFRPGFFFRDQLHPHFHRCFQSSVEHRVHPVPGIFRNHLMVPFLKQFPHSFQICFPAIHQLKIHKSFSSPFRGNPSAFQFT